jgi:hypothetical protein
MGIIFGDGRSWRGYWWSGVISTASTMVGLEGVVLRVSAMDE